MRRANVDEVLHGAVLVHRVRRCDLVQRARTI